MLARKYWDSWMIQVVEFKLDDAFYAMKTDQVEEIVDPMASTRMPKGLDWMDGLVNLRGEIVILMNLRRLLDLPVSSDYDKLIVMKTGKSKVGIMVDQVLGVKNIDPSSLQPLDHREASLIAAIRPSELGIVNHLDLESFLDKRE